MRIEVRWCTLVDMGRPTPDQHAAADLAKRATKARKAWEKKNRAISDERLASEVFRMTGVYCNRGTLGKLWSGKVDPHSVGIETILAVARFLEVEPEEFGPVIAERSRQIAALVNGGELVGVGAGDGNRTRVLSLGS